MADNAEAFAQITLGSEIDSLGPGSYFGSIWRGTMLTSRIFLTRHDSEVICFSIPHQARILSPLEVLSLSADNSMVVRGEMLDDYETAVSSIWLSESC